MASPNPSASPASDDDTATLLAQALADGDARVLDLLRSMIVQAGFLSYSGPDPAMDALLDSLDLPESVLVVITSAEEAGPGDADYDLVQRNRARAAEQQARQAAEEAATRAQAAQDAARAAEVAALASARPAAPAPLPEAPNVIQLGRPKPKQPPGVRYDAHGNPVWVGES